MPRSTNLFQEDGRLVLGLVLRRPCRESAILCAAISDEATAANYRRLAAEVTGCRVALSAAGGPGKAPAHLIIDHLETGTNSEGHPHQLTKAGVIDFGDRLAVDWASDGSTPDLALDTVAMQGGALQPKIPAMSTLTQAMAIAARLIHAKGGLQATDDPGLVEVTLWRAESIRRAQPAAWMAETPDAQSASLRFLASVCLMLSRFRLNARIDPRISAAVPPVMGLPTLTLFTHWQTETPLWVRQPDRLESKAAGLNGREATKRTAFGEAMRNMRLLMPISAKDRREVEAFQARKSAGAAASGSQGAPEP